MNTKFIVSVIVCTYNRCESLRDTLAALKTQRISNGLSLEIIVVDNNSKDRTKQVVQEAAKDTAYPIQYVFESIQGLSHARNSGIIAAKGDLIAFTDDDVIPDEDWVEALWSGSVTFEADCIGGRILPLWELTPPPWLHDKLLLYLALVDHGPETIEANSYRGDLVFGANIAFRKGVFDDQGVFRTDLGRIGTTLLSGEEGELLQRLCNADKRLVYIPGAVVYHKIPPERLTKEFFRSRVYWSGRSGARFENYSHGLFYNIKSILRKLLWDIPLLLPKVIYWKLNGEKKFYFDVECRFIEAVGYIHEFVSHVGNRMIERVTFIRK